MTNLMASDSEKWQLWMKKLPVRSKVNAYVSFKTVVLESPSTGDMFAVLRPWTAADLQWAKDAGYQVSLRNWHERDLPESATRWAFGPDLWSDFRVKSPSRTAGIISGVAAVAMMAAEPGKVGEIATQLITLAGLFAALYTLFSEQFIGMAFERRPLRTTHLSKSLLQQRTLLRWLILSIGASAFAIPVGALASKLTPYLDVLKWMPALPIFVGATAAGLAITNVLTFLVHKQAQLFQLASLEDDRTEREHDPGPASPPAPQPTTDPSRILPDARQDDDAEQDDGQGRPRPALVRSSPSRASSRGR